MRIAINGSILDATPSGLGVYAANLISAIKTRHEDCLIYTSYPGGLNVAPAPLRSVHPCIQPSRGRWGHLMRLAWTQGVLPFQLLCDRATVFFSPLSEGMLWPCVPQVIVIHDLHPLHFQKFWPERYYYFRYIVPILLQRSRAIIAISENTRRDIVAFYKVDSHRVHVIPPGYDHNRYHIEINPSTILEKYHLQSYLLYVGNLLPHKNLHRLLKAFAGVTPQIPPMLVIVGKRDTRYYPALEIEARQLGILQRVLFLDYLPAGDLPALYAGATALVLPSLYEGFGLTALEAMACGTPVIAANKASIPEVTGDSAILFDPESVAEMSHAMETVLTDPEKRRVMREKGLKQAKRFSWDKTAMATLQVLQDVLKNKKP